MSEYFDWDFETIPYVKDKSKLTPAQSCRRGIAFFIENAFKGSGFRQKTDSILSEYIGFNNWQISISDACIQIQSNWHHFVQWFKTRKGTRYYDSTITVAPRPLNTSDTP